MVSGEARRYHVLAVLGRGAFGTVYRARGESDGGFEQVVALKLLHPDKESDPHLTRRLRDEARVLALVRHRAIVRVHGLANLSGRWGVVMELVEGVDLRAVLTRGPLPARVAVAIAAEVATALSVAWATPGPTGEPLRLVHRDIKPSNLYLSPHGEVKILDFGIARVDGLESGADAGTMFGTEAYMSPERRDYRDGPEGDVYGLGAVLYELITGQMFGATFVREERHAEKLAGALALLPEDGPAGVANVRQILADMLAFEPTARPAASDLRRRLLRVQAELAGPDLEEWAETTVPKIAAAQAAPELQPSDPVGELLHENVAQASADPLTLVPEDTTDASPIHARAPDPARLLSASEAPLSSASGPAGAPSPPPPSPDTNNVARSNDAEGGVGGSGGPRIPTLSPTEPVTEPRGERVVPATPAPEPSPIAEPPGVPRWLTVAWAGLGLALLVVAGWAWSMYSAPATSPDPADLAPVETRVAPEPPAPEAPRPDSTVPAPTVAPTPPSPPPAAASGASNAPRASGTPAPPVSTEGGPTEGGPTVVTPTEAGTRTVVTGTIRVEGDASSVEFRSGSGARRAGALPTGTYEVWADFGDGQARQQGRVTVRADETTVVKCSTIQGRCVIRVEGG